MYSWLTGRTPSPSNPRATDTQTTMPQQSIHNHDAAAATSLQQRSRPWSRADVDPPPVLPRPFPVQECLQQQPHPPSQNATGNPHRPAHHWYPQQPWRDTSPGGKQQQAPPRTTCPFCQAKPNVHPHYPKHPSPLHATATASHPLGLQSGQSTLQPHLLPTPANYCYCTHTTPFCHCCC